MIRISVHPSATYARKIGHLAQDYKNQNHGNQVRSTEAHGMVHALRGETNQDIDDMGNDINA